MEIAGKTVLITGSNRGIGKAIAEAVAARGAHVLAASRRRDQVDGVESSEDFRLELTAKGAIQAEIVELDLSSYASIERGLEKIDKHRVDIIINNAGILTGGLIEKQPLEEVYAMMQVNLTGLMHLTARLLPRMLERKSGKIVNNASVSGVMHIPTASTYAASKAGVVAFTESLAGELTGTGVSTLLLLTPGVDTRMFSSIPEKYGPNLDFAAIASAPMPPAQWADSVVEAIEDDREVLYPSGSTFAGVLVAQHAPKLFRRGVLSKFHR